MTNDSNGGFLFLTLDFLLYSPWLLKEKNPSEVMYLHLKIVYVSVYMHLYIYDIFYSFLKFTSGTYLSSISHLIAHNPPSELNLPYPDALSFVLYHMCPLSNFFFIFYSCSLFACLTF